VSPQDPHIGTEFAGYRIEALIGQGGMGAVYIAEQVRLKRRVALKLLTPQLAEDEGFRERFIRESQVAAACEHPNVIPIYDASEDDGVLFIAMRFIEGSDLRSVLRLDGRLTPERTTAIVEQVGGALDAAHAQGLVHRDVKPANILIDQAGDRVYLTDFGVAKQTAATGLTRTGFFIGTLDYAAPEQIEGKPVTPLSDVYALGCVAYECLAGEPPFVRESDGAVMYAHLMDDPPLLTERRPDLPAAVDTVIMRALAKPPEDRFATCGRLSESLRAALVEGTPTRVVSPVAPATTVEAPPAPPPPQPPPAPARPGWLVPLLVALGIALLAAGALGAVALLRGGDEPTADPTTITPEPRTVTVVPETPTTVSDGTAEAEAANRAYVDATDRLLTNSAETRDDLGDLVNVVSAGTISADDAKGRIAAIISQRQSLQNAVATVPTPPPFVPAASLLRRSIRASLDDDFAIQSWIYARFGDDPAADTHFDEHLRASARASKAKLRFVTTYDRLRAQLLGLPPLPTGTDY
jgi:serine/threonine-protein kinase